MKTLMIYTCGYSAGTCEETKNHPFESRTTKAPVWLRKVKLILRKAFAAFVSRLYFFSVMQWKSYIFKCGLCVQILLYPLCHSIISAQAFCCVGSATLSSRKCKSTSVCCVPAVLQSVWLVYSASAGVGRLLARTLWCSAHVISLISLCVCASRWVLDSGSERMWTHTPETHCAHSCLDSTHPKPSLLFPQSASLISAFASRCGVRTS